MNVYQMYGYSGNRVSFWIKRKNWTNTVAKVTSIANQKSGRLKGTPPYFNNPIVKAHIFNLSTGELLEENATLSCPGAYTYELIETKNIPDSIKNHPNLSKKT
jgi:hypothetical protein